MDRMDMLISLVLVCVLVLTVAAVVAGFRTPPIAAAGSPVPALATAGAPTPPRTVEALVVPFGAPRHAWPGGEVTSLHTPAALRNVVERFVRDGRPVPLVEETDPAGAPLGWIVAMRVEGDGLHARIALAEGANLAGRFLAPSLEEEVAESHPATAVPLRLARVFVTDRPSLPAPATEDDGV